MSVKTPNLGDWRSGFWRKDAQGKAGNSRRSSLVTKRYRRFPLAYSTHPGGPGCSAECKGRRAVCSGDSFLGLPESGLLRGAGGAAGEGFGPALTEAGSTELSGTLACGSAPCQLCNLGKLLTCSGPRLNSKMGILFSEELDCGLSESV